MIFKGSRYADVKTYIVSGPGGRTVTALGIRLIPATPAGFFVSASAAQRLDHFAFNFYRNPEKFWLIADANTEMDAEDLLEPGAQLLIPPDKS